MHPRAPLSPSRFLIALMSLGLMATFFTATSAGASPLVTETAAVAWSVETVDGPNGERRANFSYALDPGAQVSDVMRVTNTGGSVLDLAVYSADAYTTTTGNIDLDTPDIEPDDAGAWIAIDRDRLLLQPGEQADVSFTVAVPENATPGDHSAGIITSLSTDQNATLSVDRRLGTRMTVRVSGDLVPAVEVSDITSRYVGSWNPFAPGTLKLDYTLTNSGNVRVTATETVTASGPLGMLAANQPVAPLPEVLPGSTIEVEREIRIAPGGWISGDVLLAPEAVGLGAQSLDAISLHHSTAAVPWMLLAILVVIALVILGILYLRRRAAPAAPPSDAHQP